MMNDKYRIGLIGLILSVGICAWGQNARKARRGIIVVEDSVRGVRAMEPFKGLTDTGYADVVNAYQKAFPEVRVYCMVIPNAVAIYCPDSLKDWTREERPAIAAIEGGLVPAVKRVSILDTLLAHREEPIYARTDHHWAALGAYYAAKVLAEVAEVPFRGLEDYEEHVLQDYVGSMWTFSRDPRVKAQPETFVWYEPKDTAYQVEQIRYHRKRTGRGRRVRTFLVASAPEASSFFRHYEDGDAAAYCTFMGGDLNTTSIRTATRNGRRLLILKDSYGNALPAFLFGSFEEIHVVDCRYFLQGMRAFVREKGITDILFANNLIHATMAKICENYRNFLNDK